MGLDGVQDKSFKFYEVDLKPKQSTSTYQTRWQAPSTELNGNANWGVGDGFVPSGNESDANIDNANAALSSDDKGTVSSAKDGLSPYITSPDDATPVYGAYTMYTNQEGNVVSAEGSHSDAVAGQGEAEKGVSTSKTNVDNRTQAVTDQQQTVDTCKTNLDEAKSNVQSCDTKLSQAKASLAEAKSTVASAEAALKSAQSADPVDSAAVAAAQTALETAKAAEQTAQSEVELAEAELEKAKAEKTVAENQLKEAEAKLAGDEEALTQAKSDLEKANGALDKANKNVETAQTKLDKAKSDLAVAKEKYEKVKDDIKEQSKDLYDKLENLLDKLENGEEDSQKSKSSTSKKLTLDKIASGFNFGTQAFDASKQFANLFSGQQNQANTDESSNKRPMTAQESASLNHLLGDVGEFCNNLFKDLNVMNGQTPTSGTANVSNSNVATEGTQNSTNSATTNTSVATNDSATSNPFVLKKKV